jgi:hypothetical protein
VGHPARVAEDVADRPPQGQGVDVRGDRFRVEPDPVLTGELDPSDDLGDQFVHPYAPLRRAGPGRARDAGRSHHAGRPRTGRSDEVVRLRGTGWRYDGLRLHGVVRPEAVVRRKEVTRCDEVARVDGVPVVWIVLIELPKQMIDPSGLAE